jgi:hypothetical protein
LKEVNVVPAKAVIQSFKLFIMWIPDKSVTIRNSAECTGLYTLEERRDKQPGYDKTGLF